MRVEIEDLRRVVNAAQRTGRHVVVGGHSLGGSITTAYATWDFGGRPGARGLSGLVYIDGGSSPPPLTAGDASARSRSCGGASPWLTFGGIMAPFTGPVQLDRRARERSPTRTLPSLGQAWPLLPANLKPPVPVTNRGQYGYALTPRPLRPA